MCARWWRRFGSLVATRFDATRFRVVAVASDAGGANAVAPVIRALRVQEQVEVHALAHQSAATVWKDWRLSCERLPRAIPTSLATARLRDVSLLLTGTSAAPIDCEKKFIAAARASGIPSLAVLDFWSNYAERFSDARGRLIYLPDRIAVMDTDARDAMIAAGIPPDRLVVTGQPAFDELADLRRRFTPTQRRMIRINSRVPSNALLVLFVSQPLVRLFGTDATNPRCPGYDERSAFSAVVSALEEIAAQSERDVVLIVRQHPKERVGQWRQAQSEQIRIDVLHEHSPRQVMLAADLVVGMTSTLLVEACLLGCVTVSLQPNLRTPDKFPLSRWGVGCSIYRADEIKPALEKLLLDDATRATVLARSPKLKLDGQATQRVIELTGRMS